MNLYITRKKSIHGHWMYGVRKTPLGVESTLTPKDVEMLKITIEESDWTKPLSKKYKKWDEELKKQATIKNLFAIPQKKTDKEEDR